MSSNAVVVYDKEFDNLYIHKNREKSEHSLQVSSNFIIDIDHEEKVVGLEILNASKVLKVSKEDLSGVKAAQMSVLSNPKYFEVLYEIVLPKKTVIESGITVPQLATR